MRRIVPAGLAGTVAALLGLVPAGSATAAVPRVVDVAGLSGRTVDIAAAGRLADGGAIVAGTVTPPGRGARPGSSSPGCDPTGSSTPPSDATAS